MKKINTLLAFIILFFSFSIHAQVNIEWQKSLGDASKSGGPVKPTADGGYIVAGGSVSKVHYGPFGILMDNIDLWLIKLDHKGVIQWQKIIGDTTLLEFCSAIGQTTDGGYILAGTKSDINYFNYPKRNYWIVKLSAGGQVLWEKSFGGSEDDKAEDIQQTADGGYIVAGSSYSNDGDVSGNHGKSDCWMVKLTASGNITWQKSLGGSEMEFPSAIRQTIDGGYIMAGTTYSNDGQVTGNHGKGDWWVVKLNNSGSIQWQKCLGGSSTYADKAFSIEQTSDSGYIVAGQTDSFDGDVTGNHGGEDWWIVKLNNGGDVQWKKCFGGQDYEGAGSIKQTTDGGYIVVGNTGGDNAQAIGYHGGGDIWMVKLSNLGDLLWQKCLGGTFEEQDFNFEQTSDGGYVLSGNSESDDGDVTGKQGVQYCWIVKLTAEQKLLVPTTTTVTKNITGNSATDVDSLNYKLVTLTPTGNPPNALSGNVTTTATVNSTISTFNNLPFVRRHYDIAPAINPNNAQAIVTLYFTQNDFDLFNAYVTTNNLNIPLLPTGGVDNGNLRITQFHGNFTGTSDPANYNGGTTLIAPPALVVTWDNTNNYWIVSFPVTHFSGFYLSTVDLIILPLTLLEFKGSLQESEASLQWSTTNEINTKEFVVERSNNSTGYIAIGKVSAQSTSENHHYQFSDANPLEGNNFYRLKMVDKDGNFSYSNTAVIKMNNVVSKIIVYPNPSVNNLINLRFINQPKGIYNLRLINYSGQVIHTKQISHTEGSQVEALPLNSSIQKGHYVLEVIAPDNNKHLLKIIF